MRLVMDTQIRLTEFKNSLKKDAFVESLSNDNHIILNDKSVFLWDYPNKLDNEKVFNSFCIIDNITIFLDSETQLYEAYKDGVKFDHEMFKDIARWIKIKYDDDKKRLLSKMRKFREELLNHSLNPLYYRGIFSDRFTVFINDKEVLLPSWDNKNDKKMLGVDENFSFFLKVCKLIL
jgi:hypothetical protein